MHGLPEPLVPAPRPTKLAYHPNATQTLNRLEFSRRRKQRINCNDKPAMIVRQSRNQNSIGDLNDNKTHPICWQARETQHIYAPASIAGHGDECYRRRCNIASNLWSSTSGSSASPAPHTNHHELHYASSSCRSHTTTSNEQTTTATTTTTSGRDSALGSLFGSLRRKCSPRLTTLGVRRRRAKSETSASSSSMNAGSSKNNSSSADTTQYSETSPCVALDPEIYGKLSELKAEHIYAEGQRALEFNYQTRQSVELNWRDLEPGQTRVLIPDADRQPDLQKLIKVLKNWINDLLASQRILVTNLQEDLYDGQIFVKLVERLFKTKLDVIEVTQNESLQKQRLHLCLAYINKALASRARWAKVRWSVDGIHSRNMPDIIHLLVFLAIFHRAPIQLPPNVTVRVLEIHRKSFKNANQINNINNSRATYSLDNEINSNLIEQRSQLIQLTDTYETCLDNDCLGLWNNKKPEANGNESNSSQDAFDMLVERASPEKLATVKRSLVKFANRHLDKLNLSCWPSININSERINQSNYQDGGLDPNHFSDGLLIVFLIASLENYFVPLGYLYMNNENSSISLMSKKNTHKHMTNPGKIQNDNYNQNIYCDIETSAIQSDSFTNTHPIDKLHNVNFALNLIEEAGIKQVRDLVRAEDIVNGDLKATLRLLYMLFSHYRHL